jgi:hypothetical protein
VWVNLAHRGAEWRVETEDVGPGGCLVRSERLLVPGLDVHVVLQRSAVSDELAADGKVAWYEAPRAGIAFDPRLLRSRAPNAWFRKLLAADRRLALAAARTPIELELDTRLFLPTPPRIVDLRPDEALVVGCAEQGMPVRHLLTCSGLSEQRLGQLIFALLEKRVFTLAAGEAGEAWKWRAALADPRRAPDPQDGDPGPELSLIPAPRAPRPPILTRARAPAPAAAVAPSPAPPAQSERPAAPGPTSEASPTRSQPHGPAPAVTPAAAQPAAPASPDLAPQGRYEPRTGAKVMARLLHGVSSNERPPGAAREFGRAREAEAAGRVAEAIKFMRSALAMAPQDREIAGELARLAFIHPTP